jgi:hypothetical protein
MNENIGNTAASWHNKVIKLIFLINFLFFIQATNKRVHEHYFPTLIPLSGVGTTCFSSCFDRDPDVNPPWNWSGC